MRLLRACLSLAVASASLILVFLAWVAALPVLVMLTLNAALILLLLLILRLLRYGVALPIVQAFCWPGIGPLLLAGTVVFERWHNREGKQLEAYQRYIVSMEQASEARALNRIQVVKEINVLHGAAEIMHADYARKKHLILHAKDIPEPESIPLLKKALHDEDPEVKHYAATTLARLSQQYDESIFALSKEAHVDSTKMPALLRLYEQLLDSNLLSDGIRPHYVREYAKWLEIAHEKASDEFRTHLGLLNVALEQGNWGQALAYLSELEPELMDKTYIWLTAMNIYFARREYRRVAEYAGKLAEGGFPIPPEYDSVVAYWA